MRTILIAVSLDVDTKLHVGDPKQMVGFVKADPRLYCERMVVGSEEWLISKRVGIEGFSLSSTRQWIRCSWTAKSQEKEFNLVN
jgi:hypothetical protein